MQSPPIFLFISGKDGSYLSLFLRACHISCFGLEENISIRLHNQRLFAFEWCVHKQQLTRPAQYVLMFKVLPLQLIIIMMISCLS